jgi:hypothetical protein
MTALMEELSAGSNSSLVGWGLFLVALAVELVAAWMTRRIKVSKSLERWHLLSRGYTFCLLRQGRHSSSASDNVRSCTFLLAAGQGVHPSGGGAAAQHPPVEEAGGQAEHVRKDLRPSF